eukprot:maker-scaffold_15-snap-gene-3.26-mRNA-1 protein AED:0.03 eAED:0.03 QI:111/1/1/1/0.5/0.33/3/130/528
MKFLSLAFIIPFLANCEEEEVSEPEIETFKVPELDHPERIFFFENFQKEGAKDPEDFGWVVSASDEYSQQEVEISDKYAAYPEDSSLLLLKKHARYGLSKKLAQPFNLDSDQVTIQFEVKFNKGWGCSGAYLKFVAGSDSVGDQKEFSESTPYVIMFGPDKCGGTNKVHLIFRHQNPISGEWEEKHLAKKVMPEQDEFSHVYTLQLKKSDSTARVLVDRQEQTLASAVKGKDFKPSFFPSEEIDDPEDIKPEDWVDDEIIPDPEDIKPENWIDDPELEFIVDPDASMPDDWDEEEDGEWEAPKIKNPDFDGVWKPKMIDNPEYKGEWSPKKIPNPHYFTQEFPFSELPPISHVFVEVLANNEDISFDNILISVDYETGKEVSEKYYFSKVEKEKAMEQEKRLADKKEERLKNLEEEFGFYSVVEYIYGEVSEFYELHPIITIMILVSMIVIPFYFICIKGDFFRLSDAEIAEAAQKSWEDRQKREAAKKKKDDGDGKNEKEDEQEPESKGTEEKKADSTVRRRAKRAD